MSLQNLAKVYSEGVLDFVWRQWAQLGVSGPRLRRDRWSQDPEALLAFSLEVARYEPRMFDEILDWLVENGNEVMWQRVKNVMAYDSEIPSHVIEAAIERTTSGKGPKSRAQQPLNPEAEPLFRGIEDLTPGSFEPDPIFLAHGLVRPPFLRSDKSTPIRRTSSIAFAFKVRALFGASARSEALRYLLLRQGQQAGTVEIADAVLLSRYSLHQALEELAQAGLVRKTTKGRKDLNWSLVDPSSLSWVYPSDGSIPSWVGWPSVYHGLALIWRWLLAPQRNNESPYIQASGARALMKYVSEKLAYQGLRWQPSDPSSYPGVAYLDPFRQDIEALVAALNEDDALGIAQFEGMVEAIAHRPFSKSRHFEVSSGELMMGNVAAHADSLTFSWQAFEGTQAIITRIETDRPPHLLLRTGANAGELLDEDDYGRYTGSLGDGNTLELDDVWITGHTLSLRKGELSKVRIGYRKARMLHSANANPTFVRYILSNIQFNLWPRATKTIDGGWTRDTLPVAFSGTSLQLTELDKSLGLASLVLDAHIDEQYNPSLVEDLSSLLSFLMGAHVHVLARESYDAMGEIVTETWHPSNDSIESPRFEPIDWNTMDSGQMLLNWRSPEVISTLLKSYTDLNGTVDLSSMIGLMISSNKLPIETACLLRIMALRKILNAHERNPRKTGASHFRITELMSELGITLDPEETKQLLDGIEAADTGSLISRAKDKKELQARLGLLGTLVKLSNAVFLRTLGYEGPVVDYGKPGYPSVHIGATSAK